MWRTRSGPRHRSARRRPRARWRRVAAGARRWGGARAHRRRSTSVAGSSSRSCSVGRSDSTTYPRPSPGVAPGTGEREDPAVSVPLSPPIAVAARGRPRVDVGPSRRHARHRVRRGRTAPGSGRLVGAHPRRGRGGHLPRDGQPTRVTTRIAHDHRVVQRQLPAALLRPSRQGTCRPMRVRSVDREQRIRAAVQRRPERMTGQRLDWRRTCVARAHHDHPVRLPPP